jgi:hypothetical protein
MLHGPRGRMLLSLVAGRFSVGGCSSFLLWVLYCSLCIFLLGVLGSGVLEVMRCLQSVRVVYGDSSSS